MNAPGTLGPAEQAPLTRSFVWLGAIATGIIVTNLFAPQILIGLIGPSLHMTEQQAGMVSTLTLLGYAFGLFFLVPLVDIFENRRLILLTLCGEAAAALCTAVAPTPALLLGAVFLLGACCAAIQMLVPLVASMARPEQRGQVIGDVMSGAMVGILLSRPLASFIADVWHWRGFYVITAVSTGFLTATLGWRLPLLQPAARVRYARLVGSFLTLLLEEPVLRVRAWTAALVAAAVTAYWAAVALKLAAAPLELTPRGIAVFALVGAVGGMIAPVAGRWADRGHARQILVASHAMIIVSSVLCASVGLVDMQVAALITLGLGAVLLDIGATSDQTVGRRAVNLLRPEARGRMNGLFVGLLFIGGGVGAAAAAITWPLGGFTAVCAVAACFGIVALLTDLATKTGTS